MNGDRSTGQSSNKTRRDRERSSKKERKNDSHEQQRNCAMVFSARSSLPFLVQFSNKYPLQFVRPMVHCDNVATVRLPTSSRRHIHIREHISKRARATHTCSRTIRRISFVALTAGQYAWQFDFVAILSSAEPLVFLSCQFSVSLDCQTCSAHSIRAFV